MDVRCHRYAPGGEPFYAVIKKKLVFEPNLNPKPKSTDFPKYQRRMQSSVTVRPRHAQLAANVQGIADCRYVIWCAEQPSRSIPHG